MHRKRERQLGSRWLKVHMTSIAVFPLPIIHMGLSASREYFMTGCHLAVSMSAGQSECTAAETAAEKSMGDFCGTFTPVAMIILSARMVTGGGTTPQLSCSND